MNFKALNLIILTNVTKKESLKISGLFSPTYLFKIPVFLLLGDLPVLKVISGLFAYKLFQLLTFKYVRLPVFYVRDISP